MHKPSDGTGGEQESQPGTVREALLCIREYSNAWATDCVPNR